jgi:hypothetical protein
MMCSTPEPPDPRVLQAAALDMYGWLAYNDPDVALPAAIHIVASALRSLVPGADDPASAQMGGIVSNGMTLLHEHLVEYAELLFGWGSSSFVAIAATAGMRPLPHHPQWQADTLELATRFLEHTGVPRRCQIPPGVEAPWLLLVLTPYKH